MTCFIILLCDQFLKGEILWCQKWRYENILLLSYILKDISIRLLPAGNKSGVFLENDGSVNFEGVYLLREKFPNSLRDQISGQSI